jgi:hypothetical protein
MFAYDIQESTAYALRIAITVLVFAMKLVFVGWCCLKLVPALKAKVAAVCATAKKWAMGAVQRAFACMGHPITAGQSAVCAVGSAGQQSEAGKDPSTPGQVAGV